MQTLGQRLKTAREGQKLTLEKVFQATRIRIAYLQALEDDDLSVMPSPVQARGYLRNYAEYLGLNLDRLLEEVRASQKNIGEVIPPADLTPAPAARTPEPPAPQDAPPPTPPTVEPALETESQLFDVAQDKPEPTPTQPKRRGRKKAEPSADAIVEEATVPKRRGRKKAAAEPESALEEAQVVESKPEVREEAPAQPEPVTRPLPPPGPEQTPQPNVSEGLWQIWLNRVGSVINRKQETPAEVKPEVELVQEAEPASEPEPFEPSNLEPSNLQPSDAIFKEIGAELRTRREMLSLHLEEVERNTKVKAHYLEALELGALDRLPSTVQTRGMLSNYASFLDMDVDATLLRFADALQARHRERNPQKPARKPGQPILANMPALRNFIAGDMIFGIGIAVLLVGFVIWGINRVLTLQSLEQVEPTAPSISDVLLASPDPSQFTATATLLPVESFGEEATPTIIIPTVNINVSVQVNLVAVERTYLRVIADGRVVFEGRVIPGNAYLFEAEEQVEVLVGSGGAVRIAYNGRDLGLMGTFGQIVNNIYRADGIITPTALPSPTPTVTVPPSPTVRPSNTPVPSNTPAPSNTPSP